MRGNYIGLTRSIDEALEHFFAALFPGFFGKEADGSIPERKSEAEREALGSALRRSLLFVTDEGSARSISQEVLDRLPGIECLIRTDIRAAFEGDPAAKSEDEVILCYPCFKAISTYRLAHELYLMGAPVIPRMMTELMHSLTGIDIHPGASIGPSFFIDHGTGVVIGETTTIGEHVKLYQHVTLGAKSFDSAPDGTLIKGIKRHPDIGSNAVIYAGATILGGNTVIGDGAVIGGNSWVTHSVAAGAVVTIRSYAGHRDVMVDSPAAYI